MLNDKYKKTDLNAHEFEAIYHKVNFEFQHL